MSEEERVLGLRPEPPHGTLVYGPHADQVVDLWHPSPKRGTGPPPGIVLIHGGFWRHRYDRQHLSPLAARLAREGYAVTSVEYRRVGGDAPDVGAGGGFPGTFDDIEAALAMIREEAGGRVAAGFRRPVVVGHSAGGQLALWAVSRPGTAIRKAVALAPVADLARAADLGTGAGAVRALLGGDLSRLPGADPAALLPTGVPTCLIHGRDDEDVPVELSERFVAAARAAGDDPRLTVLDGTGHYALIDPDSPAHAVLTNELDRRP